MKAAPSPSPRVTASRERTAASALRVGLYMAAITLNACVPTHTIPRSPDSVRRVSPVAVRLAQAEGISAIQVETPRGPLTLSRRGQAIETSDGRRASSILIEGAARTPGRNWASDLRTLERSYPGELRVELHPREGLRVVNLVDLEAYVAGVVASEVSLWSAQPAELEAQAIAARTYAIAALRDGAPLYDDTRDQAYRGRFVPGQGSNGAALARKLRGAVAATRSLVLTEALGELPTLRYHAACGGRTADSARGTGVTCDACAARAQAERLAGRPDARRPLAWRHRVQAAELGALAARLDLGTRLRSLSPVRVDVAGRWLEVELIGDLGKRRIPFDRLRHLLGSARLKSGLILRTLPREGEAITSELLFEGLGRGHGQGLCQEGAHDYALRGWSSTQILAHYYPGALVRRAPDSALLAPLQ